MTMAASLKDSYVYEGVVAKIQHDKLESRNMPRFYFNIEEFYQSCNLAGGIFLLSSRYVVYIKIFI